MSFPLTSPMYDSFCWLYPILPLKVVYEMFYFLINLLTWAISLRKTSWSQTYHCLFYFLISCPFHLGFCHRRRTDWSRANYVTSCVYTPKHTWGMLWADADLSRAKIRKAVRSLTALKAPSSHETLKGLKRNLFSTLSPRLNVSFGVHPEPMDWSF